MPQSAAKAPLTCQSAVDGMPLIGPHEGQEFALLNSGHKNVALFYEIIPEDVEAFRNKPGFVVCDFDQRFEVPGRTAVIPYVILYRKGFETDAQELHRLLQRDRPKFDPLAERRIGEILGYPPQAIDHFIACWPSGTAPA